MVDAFSYDPTKKPDVMALACNHPRNTLVWQILQLAGELQADYSKPDPLSIANSGLDIQRRALSEKAAAHATSKPAHPERRKVMEEVIGPP